MYYCPSCPFVPRDTRTEVGCTSVPQILLCTTVHPVHLYHETQGQKWDVLVYHRYCCPSCPFVPRDTRIEVGCTSVPLILLCTSVCPVHLYHGTQGQKWDVLVYHRHRYCCVLLSIPSICTTGHKDRSGMY